MGTTQNFVGEPCRKGVSADARHFYGCAKYPKGIFIDTDVIAFLSIM